MKKSNILVVDDSVLVLLGLNKALVNDNLNVHIASDGKKAMDILNSEKIDLVILDIMMPIISGFDVLDSIKADSNLKDIPVIVLSGIEDVAVIDKALSKGAAEYLHKPIAPNELIMKINKILKR